MKTLTKFSLTAVLVLGLATAFGNVASAKDAPHHKKGSHHASHHHKHHDKHASLHKHHGHDVHVAAHRRHHAKKAKLVHAHRRHRHHHHRRGVVNFATLLPSHSLIVFEAPLISTSPLTLGSAPVSLPIVGLQ